MSILVADIEFSGPHRTPVAIADQAGIFVVMQEHDDKFEVIDFGYSDNLRNDLVDADEFESWTKQYPGVLFVGVHYISESDKALSGSLVKTIEDWFENAEPPLVQQLQLV
ncbi:hypothetical protein BH11CYA1_BH11CYA1_33190 [soil metagenome]